MLKKLRSHILKVARLDEAKAWYSAYLGFPPYFDEPYYVGFDVHGCELGLDPDMTGVVRGREADAYWQVEQLESALEKALTMGAALEIDIRDVGGGIRMAVFKDPFENRIGLIEG